MATDHSCVALAVPIVDGYDDESDEPIMSSALGSEVEVYCRCSQCDQEVVLTYEYQEARFR